jgi:hypothetical protein
MSLLLEANGWAVNVQMRLNRHVGRLFTRVPDLPREAVRVRKDVLASSTDGSTDWLVAGGLALLAAGALAYYYFRVLSEG